MVFIKPSISRKKAYRYGKQEKKARCKIVHTKKIVQGFPGGTVVKNLPANAGDTGSSPGPGRSHMPQSN